MINQNKRITIAVILSVLVQMGSSQKLSAREGDPCDTACSDYAKIGSWCSYQLKSGTCQWDSDAHKFKYCEIKKKK